MSFKVGDRVKVVKVCNDSYENRKKFLGLCGVVEYVPTDENISFSVDFREINDYHYFDADELELIQEGKQMSAKFKVGDEVRVTASLEELQLINASKCFGKTGKVLEIKPLVFLIDISGLENNLRETCFLNYAHAELVEPKQESKFKVGDLVRKSDALFVVSEVVEHESICYPQIESYKKFKTLSTFKNDELTLVTKLKVGDRIVTNPVEVEIVFIDSSKDKEYEVEFQNGLKTYIPNEFVPLAKVPPKFEVGDLVFYQDANMSGVGKVASDDCGNPRYRVEYNDDFNFFYGNELTKIPQELYEEILKEIKKED